MTARQAPFHCLYSWQVGYGWLESYLNGAERLSSLWSKRGPEEPASPKPWLQSVTSFFVIA